MKKFSLRKSSFSKYWTLALLIALLVFFGLQYHTFLSPSSLNNLVRQMAILLIASMGMTMLIVMGSIDVSAGAGMTFCATMAALACPLLGWGAVFVGMLAGILIGISNGLIATRMKIPTFLSTIAMMGILNGASAFIMRGSPLNINSDSFLAITKGSLIGNVSNLTLIPIPIIILAVFLLKKTAFGRELYAIGGNEYVSHYSGVKVVGAQILAFSIHGALVGLAGSMQASSLEAASPFMGDIYTLSLIAVVVMGGTPLSGGKGGALGTVLGAALITVLSSGMNFMGVTPEVRSIAMGVLIIIGAVSTKDNVREVAVK